MSGNSGRGVRRGHCILGSGGVPSFTARAQHGAQGSAMVAEVLSPSLLLQSGALAPMESQQRGQEMDQVG